MTGLCSIKILLLWAGIIGVADCQATPGPAPPQCSYTVTPIKFGFQIDFTNSPFGTYTINVKEEGRNETAVKYVSQHSNQNSPYYITHLKPCTVYEHNVAFIKDGNETLCDRSDSTVKTNEMTNGDIKLVSCPPGDLCYKSNWNISSVQITANNIAAKRCPSNNEILCIRPGYNDICSDLTTTFTAEKCVSSSFRFTQHISAADFLKSHEINLTPPTKLPAKIKANLPPNCINLTIDYICSDSDNNTKNLSELEPFTAYTCTGQIKENNVTIKEPEIPVKIDCDLKIEKIEKSSTDTSIKLNWQTTSQNCQEVLPKLERLSYICRCFPRDQTHTKFTVNKQQLGGACHFSGLKPFTTYTCKVQPIYNNKDVGQPTEVRVKTKPGVPGDIDKSPSLPEHNLNTHKLVIRLLVFFIVCVVMTVVVYKMYMMKRRNSKEVNEDVMLESTATYANVPPS